MGYDVFSLFYDAALEELYAPHRVAAVDALAVPNGSRVLDLPCGTGQSLDLLVRAVGEDGLVLGVRCEAGILDRNIVSTAAGAGDFDGIFCGLGLTAFSGWEATFERMFALLRPGGRFVISDVHAKSHTSASRMVEVVARADLRREVWRPLEERVEDFVRVVLPADERRFGGELYVASGTRPAG
jgi:ubiquinone/menaquinone biosynthesis C-methylase UbiE